MATEPSNNAAATANRTPSVPATRNAAEQSRREMVRERMKNFGGARLKLSVIGEIPGYHLYWENDDQGAIEQLLYEGFEFVQPAEVKMQSHIVADADIGDRISRYVGKKEDGSPLRAFLMKCEDEIWADREAYRYEAADARDADIRAGRVQDPDGLYKPKGATTSVDTKFRKEY